MKYNEEQGDLFGLPNDFVLAHCIDQQAVMGAGIARVFAVKYPLMTMALRNNLNPVGCAVLYDHAGDDTHPVGNLVTKFNVGQNATRSKWPNLETIRASLWSLKFQMDYHGYRYLGLPYIGCGLDGLNWPEVREVVKSVFEDTDFEIEVRYF